MLKNALNNIMDKVNDEISILEEKCITLELINDYMLLYNMRKYIEDVIKKLEEEKEKEKEEGDK